MTLERARELAEANGCTMQEGTGQYFGQYWFDRPPVYATGYITKEGLASMSEADFIANLPDKRD